MVNQCTFCATGCNIISDDVIVPEVAEVSGLDEAQQQFLNYKNLLACAHGIHSARSLNDANKS